MIILTNIEFLKVVLIMIVKLVIPGLLKIAVF